ncbi:MAG: chloride channel protein [Deltaproteobacteria bacterium]|nr:chloride channel protein [Deltaproteobacteria bacterium]
MKVATGSSPGPASVAPRYLESVLLAAAVGVLGALANLAFRALISGFSWFFRGAEWHLLGIQLGSPRALLIVGVLASGGLCLLLLDRFFPGDVMGYGFPAFLEMVNLGNAQLKRRWILVKALGAALSLGCGASVGREGPIAQIAGAIGSAVAQLRRLSVDRAKVLIAAGAAAGIATTFNAPIGGLMFAQEIVLLGHGELANLTLLVVSTTAGVLASQALAGNAAIFPTLPFVFRSYWEMATYAALGVALGFLSAGYIRFFYAVSDFFERLKPARPVKLLGGLALVGLLAAALPLELSDGYPVIDRALNGAFGFKELALLCVGKFVSSAISLGCGAPGGVFGPIFFIGTMAGGSFQRLCAGALPGLTGPRGSYALVGLGAFLAGVTSAPLTALFLLFEMTRSYEVALPAMIATVAALVVARALEPETIDSYGLARAGKPLGLGREGFLLSRMPVESVMRRQVATVFDGASLSVVLAAAGQTSQTVLAVVNPEDRLTGIIAVRDLIGLLASAPELGPLVNAYDLCWRDCPVVGPEADLNEANQLLDIAGLGELPVVNNPTERKLLGMVAQIDISGVLNRLSLSLTTLAPADKDVFWASDYRLMRLRVPSAADAKTLRQLDPRARYGVSVLAFQDAAHPDKGFSPLAPDLPLKTGDLIVAAGRPADLRRFVRELEGIEPAGEANHGTS